MGGSEHDDPTHRMDPAVVEQLRREGRLLQAALEQARAAAPARRINVYVCPRGHETITVDVDEGVTPFMLRCRSGCDEMARSGFYRVDPNLTPAWE